MERKIIQNTYTANYGENIVICDNGATNITVTLPPASEYVYAEFYISRAPSSTGNITIKALGNGPIQSLGGTMGTTTSLSALGNNQNWHAHFISIIVNGNAMWLRI